MMAKDTKSKYLIYYDRYQKLYTRPAGYFDSLVTETVKYLGIRETVSILDIGSGLGDFLVSFNKQLGARGDYYALTVTPHEFEYINKNYPFIHVILSRQQDLLKILPNEKKFDIIINFHTLSYISQQSQLNVISQILAALKEGGVLVLGFVDDWIKISQGISHVEEGAVQFYYSPWIFTLLSRSCTLLLSSKFKDKDNYLIQFWQKTKNERAGKKVGIKGVFLSLTYIIRNNFLFINYFLKLKRKLYEMGRRQK